MFKSYDQFIFETKKGGNIANLISALTRNYKISNMFISSEPFQFNVHREEKNWKNLRDNIQLEKRQTVKGEYILEFDLDTKNYKFIIDFNMIVHGQNEKDSPDSMDTLYDRLAVVLDEIEIIKFKIESDNFSYNSIKNNSIIKNLKNFMIKMLSNDYDILSGKLFSLEQE